MTRPETGRTHAVSRRRMASLGSPEICEIEPLEPRVLLSHSPVSVMGPVETSLIQEPAAALVSSKAAAKESSSQESRAVWVWGEQTFQMMDDAGYRDAVLDFLGDEGVNVVYLYAAALNGAGDSPVVERADDFAGVISEAHARDMEVYALLDSTDVTTGSAVIDLFADVLAYNGSGRPAGERLDGVNLDIESWVDPAWDANREAMSGQYLDLLQNLMQMKDAQGDPGLQVGPAIPFWFDTYSVTWGGQTRLMNEHVQDLTDYVTVLDYRDQAGGGNGMIALVEDEIAYGDSIGKTVVVGVETKDVGDALSFFEEGERYMNRQLRVVSREFRRNPSFDGFAIHNLTAYLALTGTEL